MNIRRVAALATTAALALAAFAALAAGSASATVICNSEVQQSICPTAQIAEAGTSLGGYSSPGNGSVELAGTGYKCQYAGIENDTTGRIGSPLGANGKLGVWGCSFPAISTTSCANSVSTAPSSLNATSSGAGTVNIGTSAQHIQVTMDCEAPKTQGGHLVCTYGSSGIQFNLAKSEEGGWRLTTKEALLTLEKAEDEGGLTWLCGNGSALLTASIPVPGKTLAKAGTVVCKTEKELSGCPTGSVAPAGTAFGGIGVEQFEVNHTGFTCKYSANSTETSAEAGNPLSGEGALAGWGCSNLAFNTSSCVASVSHAPSVITASSGGAGTVTVGTSAHHVQVTEDCESQEFGHFVCTWGSAGLHFTFANLGEGWHLIINRAPLTLEKSEGKYGNLPCFSEPELTATFPVSGMTLASD